MPDEEYETLPTYRDAFWRLWEKLGYKLPGEEDKQYCFMFELELEDTIVLYPLLYFY